MTTFDELALAYDNSIDWIRRLERELPFIQKSISTEGENTILDMACGSGRHAIALAEMGFKVDAFDSSKSMIKAALKLAQERNVRAFFEVADMVNMSTKYQGNYNGILCLGNSLALLPNISILQQVLSNVSQLLSEDGVFIFQILNFDEIDASGFTTFDSKNGFLDSGEEVIFNRQFEHSFDDNEMTTLVLSTQVKQQGEWVTTVKEQKVLRLNQGIVSKLLTKTELQHFETFSDYDKNSFVQENSRSMVIRARKRL